MSDFPPVYLQDISWQDSAMLLYQRLSTDFGTLLAAASERGLCRLAFLEHTDEARVLAEWQTCWPNAQFQRGTLPWPWQEAPLHLRGTAFQRQVWMALLAIPAGETVSYGELARRLGQPRAARAVGQAVGANPVALRVPCHRVIRGDGAMGHYHWGPHIKQRLLALECAPVSPHTL